jgi:hypothetical protein
MDARVGIDITTSELLYQIPEIAISGHGVDVPVFERHPLLRDRHAYQ